MRKIKVMTVIGTRPEIIRLSRVIPALDQNTDHVLVHTGQNYDYGLNDIFFQELEIRRPDHFLNAAGATSAETIGKIIIAVDLIMDEEKPEALLILGDTNSCLSAIPAKRRKIPIFHMEAGNRCFDMRVPEEINRRIIDHTADLNLTYSTIARDYLLREGLSPDLVIKTGSPMFEVLNYFKSAIEASKVLEEFKLKTQKYFLVSAHREENIEDDNNFTRLVSILNAVAEEYMLPVIVSTHPRTQKRISLMGLEFHPKVSLLKPLGFKGYVKLQMKAKAVLSDSGTITEESSILNFPALNIRESHERPEGFEEGSVMLVGLEAEHVLQALSILDNQPRGAERLLLQVSDYNMPNVSEKVVRIIYSYTHYINRVIWKKY